VDARHLRLQAHQQARGRDVERLARRLEAPGGERARGGQLAGGLDRRAGDAARLAEADQQIDVLGPRFLLDDVLEQKVTRVRVRALGVDGRAPARELRDVLIVLAHPGAELLTRELTVDPALGERIHPAVPRGDGVLELGTEFAHGSPPGGRDDASRVGGSQAWPARIFTTLACAMTMSGDCCSASRYFV